MKQPRLFFQRYLSQQASGQVTVALIMVVVVGILVATTLTTIVAGVALGTYRHQTGARLQDIAESGLENAIIRLLRDQEYTGETTAVAGIPVLIAVSAGEPAQVVSTASVSGFSRSVSARVTIVNGLVTVSDWSEVAHAN